MKKIFKLSMISLLFLTAGCLKQITPSFSKTLHSDLEIEELRTECKAIEKEGSLTGLLEEIQVKHGVILNLLSEPDPSVHEPRVHELGLEIQAAGEKVSNLIKPEWSTDQWHQLVVWNINENDFKVKLGTHFPNGFEFLGANVHSIYFRGQEAKYLSESIRFINKKNGIQMRLLHKASALHLCQLLKTLVIVVDVKYRNFNNTNHQYFNLSFDNNLRDQQ